MLFAVMAGKERAFFETIQPFQDFITDPQHFRRRDGPFFENQESRVQLDHLIAQSLHLLLAVHFDTVQAGFQQFIKAFGPVVKRADNLKLLAVNLIKPWRDKQRGKHHGQDRKTAQSMLLENFERVHDHTVPQTQRAGMLCAPFPPRRYVDAILVSLR